MSDELEEAVLEVIRDRLRLRVEEGSTFDTSGSSERHLEMKLVLEEPGDRHSRRRENEHVLSTVYVDL